MHKGLAWLKGQHYQGRGRKEKLTKAQQKQQARQDFSRKLKWGPSDFSSEK
jgi:hypothetical protein